jgi:cell wall-associated NlpC family hydrolase
LPFVPRLPALCLFVLVLLAVGSPATASAARTLEACEPTAEPAACGGAIAPTRPPVTVRALRAARTFLGVPYAWGGESRGGLDCSGLVVVSFRAVGRELPHYTGALWQLGRPVPDAELQPGDLVFFRLSGGVPGHVGIYAGKGRYIHAPSSGGAVRYGLMSERADDYAGARRLG